MTHCEPCRGSSLNISILGRAHNWLDFHWRCRYVPYYCNGPTHPLLFIAMCGNEALRLPLRITSHRIQRDSNPQPFDREANALPSELPCFSLIFYCYSLVVYFEQRLGAEHPKRWSKYPFFLFLTFFWIVFSFLAAKQFNIIDKKRQKRH